MNKWIMSLLLLAVVSSSFSAHAQTLLAGVPDDGGGDGTGLFIELTAINNVSIDSFGLYSGADTGDPITIDIYARSGSFIGFEASSAGWTLIDSFSRNSNDNSVPDTFVLSSPLPIAAGQTAGILVVGTLGGIDWADVTGSETFSDANLSLFTDIGSNGGAFSGDLDVFRNFAGSVTYTVTGIAPSASATGIPTMSAYGLALTVLGLLLVATRRLRISSRRDQ